MGSRTARSFAVATLALAAVACTPTLDTGGLEGKLKDGIEAETSSTITGVDCPDDIEVETGGTFECTATEASGAMFTIEVVQTDDQGNVTWELIDAQAGEASPSPS